MSVQRDDVDAAEVEATVHAADSSGCYTVAMRGLTLLGLLTALGCGRQPSAERDESPPEEPSVMTSHSDAGPTEPGTWACELRVSPSGAVSFRIENQTTEALVLEYQHPLGFALEARAAGKPLRVESPPSSMQVIPKTLTTAPGQTSELPSPVRLVFSPDGLGRAEGKSPFVWHLVSAPTTVELSATRVFSNDPKRICRGRFVPTATK